MTENEYKNNTKTTAGSAVPNGSKYSEHDLDRYRRTSLIKLFAMGAALILLIVVGTISWFTMNREVENTGLQMTAAGETYQITALDGIQSIYQDYYSYMSGSQFDNSTVWKMTADNSMDNYTGGKGIDPGSYGMVSFYVKPRDSSINLDLSFEVVGYKYTETTTTVNELPVTTKSMTRVSDELQGYLSGHIMLFQNRTPIYDNSEPPRIITYEYSDPILSGTELTKIISNRTFTKANEDTPVNIYWIWPKTLSSLVDARSNANITIEPICKSDSYTSVVSNIITYPERYFYQYTATGTPLTGTIIANQYDVYGDLFDSADNGIGLNVSFITLAMTSAEHT